VAHPLSGFNAVTPRTTSGLVSALSEVAADRTCRAIGIPLGHRLLNSLRAQTKQRRLMPTCAAMQEPCRSHQPGSEAPTMACPGRDPGRQGPQAQSGVVHVLQRQDVGRRRPEGEPCRTGEGRPRPG
jgi:hypothetical protein